MDDVSPGVRQLTDYLRKLQGGPLLVEVEELDHPSGAAWGNPHLTFVCVEHGKQMKVDLSLPRARLDPLRLRQAASFALSRAKGACHAKHGAESMVDALVTFCPSLRAITRCPVCTVSGPTDPYGQIYYTIVHLNDRHRWSREQIADWLDTLDIDLTIKPPEEQDADASR